MENNDDLKASENFWSWIHKGEHFFKEKKYDEALQAYEEAIKEKNNVPFVLNYKGSTLSKLGRYKEAIEYFEKSLKLSSDEKDVWCNKGFALNAIGKYYEAIFCFEKSLQIDSNYSYAWKYKGDSYVKLNKLEEAITCFDKAINCYSKYKEAYNAKGLVLEKRKNLKDALWNFEKALRLDSNYKEAATNSERILKIENNRRKRSKSSNEWKFNIEAIGFLDQKKYKEAIKACDKAIMADPSFPNPWKNKGNALIALGKLDQGLKHLDHAIHLNPCYKEALNDKGKLFEMKGDLYNALKCFNEALLVKPDYEEAKTNKERVSKVNKYQNELDEFPSSDFISHQVDEEFQELEKNFPFLNGVKQDEKIGDGNGGIVFKGAWDKKIVALKQIKNHEIEGFIKEGEKLRDLFHPNILRFWGIWKDKGEYLLCTEFVNGGSLDDYLRKRYQEKKNLDEKEFLQFAISGAKGLKYLEHEGIIHRDIAARNFLVSIDNENINLKVSDFGLSRSLKNRAKNYYSPGSSNDIVPFQWAAIEILTSAKPQERKYTHKSDVWSYGITLWELYNHANIEPFENLSWNELTTYLTEGKRLPNNGIIPENMYKIMLKCWSENPEDRPSFLHLYSDLKELKKELTKNSISINENDNLANYESE